MQIYLKMGPKRVPILKTVIFCSSLGQDLKTSTYVPEIAFAIFISIFGLVLFSSLIGNMQVIHCLPESSF